MARYEVENRSTPKGPLFMVVRVSVKGARRWVAPYTDALDAAEVEAFLNSRAGREAVK